MDEEGNARKRKHTEDSSDERAQTVFFIKLVLFSTLTLNRLCVLLKKVGTLCNTCVLSDTNARQVGEWVVSWMPKSSLTR